MSASGPLLPVMVVLLLNDSDPSAKTALLKVEPLTGLRLTSASKVRVPLVVSPPNVFVVAVLRMSAWAGVPPGGQAMAAPAEL
jgi:hypothetical protein